MSTLQHIKRKYVPVLIQSNALALIHAHWFADVSGVSAGDHHTCAWASQGGLWCWGDNTYGQLGIGNTVQQNSPVAVHVGVGGNKERVGWCKGVRNLKMYAKSYCQDGAIGYNLFTKAS